MRTPRHIDFNPPGWGEFDAPPVEWPSYAEQVLEWQPLAYWRLGDAAGSVAYEEVAGLDGSYVDGVTPVSPGAIFRDPDPAAVFDGEQSAVSVPSTTLLNNSTACSFVFWLNYQAASVESDGAVISREAGPDQGWGVWVDREGFLSGRPRTLTLSVGFGTAFQIEGNADLVTPGVWDFYAATFAGLGAMCLYKNGRLDRSQPAAEFQMPASTEPVWIGAQRHTTRFLPAMLDELAVFDRALSAEQIALLYELGRGSPVPPVIGGAS
ncbi:MAG: LamG domain-containing protein [Planctomycetota bacterium]